MIELDQVQIDEMLRQLHLANARRVWPEIVQKAEAEQWSYRDFFALLISEEIAHRKQTRLLRVTHRGPVVRSARGPAAEDLVNERHLKRRSMVFTTNKPLSRWGAVLHDDDLAEAADHAHRPEPRLPSLKSGSCSVQPRPVSRQPAHRTRVPIGPHEPLRGIERRALAALRSGRRRGWGPLRCKDLRFEVKEARPPRRIRPVGRTPIECEGPQPPVTMMGAVVRPPVRLNLQRAASWLGAKFAQQEQPTTEGES